MKVSPKSYSRTVSLLILSIFFLSVYTACQKESLDIVENKETKAEARSTHQIRVLTWNTFLLDGPSVFGINFGPQCQGQDCINRANQICNVAVNLGNYDVLLFQEVWESAPRNALVNCLRARGFNHIRYDAQNKGSGLLTASKLPITRHRMVRYTSEHGDLLDGSRCAHDALAAKGFLYTELNVGTNCFIHVVNTHLDAGSCFGDFRAREGQMSQLDWYIRRSINTYNLEPVIIGGDLNIDDNSNQFPLFSSVLRGTTSFNAAGVSPAITTVGGTTTLDYILYRDRQRVSGITHRDFNLAPNAHPSDHLPVESAFTYNCSPRTPPPSGCVPRCPPGDICHNGQCIPL